MKLFEVEKQAQYVAEELSDFNSAWDLSEENSGIIISPIEHSPNALNPYRLHNDERYWEICITAIGDNNHPFHEIIFELEGLSQESLEIASGIYENVLENKLNTHVEAYSEP